MSSPEISPDDDPFDIRGAERKDFWVATYRCAKGCYFDRFVKFKNLDRASITTCINHPGEKAWIHKSRRIR